MSWCANRCQDLIGSAGYEVEPFASAAELLGRAGPQRHDCLVVDLRMPGVTGPELQRELGRAAPASSIVFITGHGDVPASVEAMKAGAVDFLEKPIAGEQLFDAIDRAIECSRALCAEHLEIERLRHRYQTLTPRERQVFALITAGLANKQVAAELGNSGARIASARLWRWPGLIRVISRKVWVCSSPTFSCGRGRG
jgi:FixJ family two-component response regulator